MARPLKQGVDYYPIDVGFLKDIKYRKIKKSCGPQTCEIMHCLLGNIYGDMGYFMQWDSDAAFLVADDVGAKEGQVEELVEKAVQVGFFDREKFDQYHILTSNGIQKRYKFITAKRKDIHFNTAYLIAEGDYDHPKPSSGDVSGGDNPQSKVNKSKAATAAKSASGGDGPMTNQTLVTWEKLWRRPNVAQSVALKELVDQFGDALVEAAIKIAGTKDVKNSYALSFITAVLTTWHKNKVQTLEAAR